VEVDCQIAGRLFSRVKNREAALADFVDEHMALRAMTIC
jgi:hypothetical protein